MDTEQWTRQLISKILHIIHSQWIFRKFTLHDKQKGWLRRKELHDIMEKIDELSEINVDNVQEGSRFLLEMDYDNLMKSDIHNKTYWVRSCYGGSNQGRTKESKPWSQEQNPTQALPAKINKRETEGN